MKPLSSLLAIGSAISLSACVGLTQMQDTAAKFDQGVHEVTVAELNLFNQVQSAECSRNFYTQGFNFVTARTDANTHALIPASLDLRASKCVHTELTDTELDIREKLLQSITLYADAIQTLANGTSYVELSEEAHERASALKQLCEEQKFNSMVATNTTNVNAAVITITSMIIDHSNYKHVKEAALTMQQPLAIIVEALKAENFADAKSLESKTDSLLNELKTGLSAARDKNGVASFLDIVWVRVTLQSIVIAPPDVSQMNEALDAILKANNALARSLNGGAIPEISELIARAQQVSRLFNASR